METYKSESDIDLDELYDDLDSLQDFSWVRRLERDFGESEESHLFLRTDSYNGFLYEDRAAIHVLDEELEKDPVYHVITAHYGEELEERF